MSPPINTYANELKIVDGRPNFCHWRISQILVNSYREYQDRHTYYFNYYLYVLALSLHLYFNICQCILHIGVHYVLKIAL